MVYIFFVQPGNMMTFDNEISIMQSVTDLKEKIQQKCGITVDQQVLLINGGEPLDPEKNLCSYMAGTDTNPIYLFSTSIDFSKIEKQTSLKFDDSELRQRLRDCCDLPASLDTVKKRAQLAQECYEIAKENQTFCEHLVHDQHMQQQGWSAVIANLEDIVSEFKKRWDLFLKINDDYVAEHDSCIIILKHFQEDKKILKRIPVLPILLDTERQNSTAMQSSKTSEENTASSSQETDTSKEMNLFEYISLCDRSRSFDEHHDSCLNNLKKCQSEIIPQFKTEVLEVLKEAERVDKKEIEGLGKRLYDLDQQLQKIKNYVQHQWDMSQSFLQNQQRASNLRDKSILPDLCATHQQQISYIAEYHKKLIDDRAKIIKAKSELCKSLCIRLIWVQNIQSKICGLDHKLVVYNEQINRLRQIMSIFQQVHTAPTVYMNAVAEVVRRRTFSHHFLSWSSDVACHQLAIYNDEITRRREFAATFDDHFLKSLFPGMKDLPPPFATEAPPMFDAKLPKITDEDIEKLKKDVPDLAENLTISDSSSAINFFKSSTRQEKDKADDSKAVEDKLIQAVSDVGLSSNLDKNLLKATGSETCLATTVHGVPHLKDLDKGCESETDTEEFEKVGQSPLEQNFDKDNPVLSRPEKQDASTSTEENLQTSRVEHDRLKSCLVNMGDLVKQAFTHFRIELGEVKADILSNKTDFNQHCESLSSSWENVFHTLDNQDREATRNLKREHELEIGFWKAFELQKTNEIEKILLEKNKLEKEIEKHQKDFSDLQINFDLTNTENSTKIETLQKELADAEVKKEKLIKDLTEKFKLENRTQIDNIKSRFRLMTMERSSSNSSLEKGDLSSLPNTSLLVQMQENYEMDKEQAVASAVVAEKQRFEKEMSEQIADLKRTFSEEKQCMADEIAKRINEEKDKQIDTLRERANNLNLECIKYKTTIQQLTEYASEDRSEELSNQIAQLRLQNQTLQEELEKVKCKIAADKTEELLNQINQLRLQNQSLTEELEKVKNRTGDMVASLAVHEGRVDATTSPSRQRNDMSKSDIVTSSSSNPGCINIESCKVGDIVLILWDSLHESFKIFQDSKHMYFLHSDCLESLGLHVVNGTPNKTHCRGQVIDKEYCHARKSENRYKVPKGTKFFRVKVKPAQLTLTTKEMFKMSVSQIHSHMSESQMTTSSCETDEASVGHSLPSSPTRLEVTIEEPLEILENLEQVPDITIFAEDSGVVEKIEQATAAVEQSDTEENSSKNDNDR